MSMPDILAWIVLIVLLFSTITVVVQVAMLPGMVARRLGHPWADAVAVGGWLRRVKPAHLIRRQLAILNYVNPF